MIHWNIRRTDEGRNLGYLVGVTPKLPFVETRFTPDRCYDDRISSAAVIPAQHAGSGNGPPRLGRLVQQPASAWSHRKHPGSGG